ncbi:MAG: O-antigen ligase family protein [Vicinamibacterales bacterium]
MLYACLLLYLVFIYVRPAEIVLGWETIPFVDILTGASFAIGLIAVAAKPRRFLNLPQDKLLLAFWAAIAISSAKVWLTGIYVSWLAFTPPVFLYFLVRIAVQNPRQMRGVVYLLVALNVFLAINGIVQYNTGIGLGNVTTTLDRIYGTGIFNDPNDLGMTFVMVIPFVALLMTNPNSGILQKLLATGALIVILTATYYTNSRGALLGLGAAMTCYWFLKSRSVSTIVFALGLGLLVLVAGPSRASEINATEESAQGRIQAWAQGWMMLKSNPLTGVGYDQFTEYHPQVAHNSFVHTFSEVGLIGAFCFVGMFYWFFKILAVPKGATDDWAPWLRALSASGTGVVVCMWFLSRQYVPVVYGLLALGATAAAQRERSADLPAPRTSLRDVINIGAILLGGIVLVYLSIRVLAIWG